MLDDDEILLDASHPFDMVNFDTSKGDGFDAAVVPSFEHKQEAKAEGFYGVGGGNDVRVNALGLIGYLNEVVVMREINVSEQGQYVPDISVFDYILRFAQLAQLDPSAIIAAQVYLMRLLGLNAGLELDSVNVHRLVLIASMVAQKVTTDMPFANSYWAKISGLFTLDEINAMEAEFVKLIRFDLSVDRNDYLQLAARAKQFAEAV